MILRLAKKGSKRLKMEAQTIKQLKTNILRLIRVKAEIQGNKAIAKQLAWSPAQVSQKLMPNSKKQRGLSIKDLWHIGTTFNIHPCIFILDLDEIGDDKELLKFIVRETWFRDQKWPDRQKILEFGLTHFRLASAEIYGRQIEIPG